MTQLIVARRRFLFLAPAIVAASSLMPGHSIAQLLLPPEPPLRQFDHIVTIELWPIMAGERAVTWGVLKYPEPRSGFYRVLPVALTPAEEQALFTDPKLLGVRLHY